MSFAGRICREQIDVGTYNRLLSAVNASGEFDGRLRLRRSGLLEGTAGEKGKAESGGNKKRAESHKVLVFRSSILDLVTG